MRVFITGATGFIGAALTSLLATRDIEVAILISPNSRFERLSAVKGIEKVTRIEGRLADLAVWRNQLANFKPDVCFHLAWYAEPGKYLDAPENVPMLQYSLELLHTLIEVQCGQVVMAGTCAEYDTNQGYLREDSPTKPGTIYAASKLALCTVSQFMASAAGINLAWARLFYLFGPYEDKRRLVPALIHTLRRGEHFPATAGKQVRDYLHVAEVASALWTLGTHRANGIFNVCSGQPITLRQLMETIANLMERPNLIDFGDLPYRAWEPMFVCGASTKLQELGWSPRYTLAEGLADTIKWWACQPDR